MTRPIGIILTSVDDASTAKVLARGLIDARLAACVQISPPGISLYRWQDAVQEDAECYLSIKARAESISDVVAWLQQHHPYDTPEIVVLDARASRAYADWMQQVTAAPQT